MIDEREEPMFNVGDRVKYVSDHFKDDKHNPRWNGSQGRVAGTITRVSDTGYISVEWDSGIKNGRYLDSDLELIKEDTMKYKPLKVITMSVLWEAQVNKTCTEFLVNWDGLRNFIKPKSLNDELDFDRFIQFAETRPGLIEWLVDKWFIGEDEQTFTTGQCFYRRDVDETYALVSCCHNEVVFTRGEARLHDAFKVSNYRNIKPSEIPDFEAYEPVPGKFVYDPKAR